MTSTVKPLYDAGILYEIKGVEYGTTLFIYSDDDGDWVDIEDYDVHRVGNVDYDIDSISIPLHVFKSLLSYLSELTPEERKRIGL